MRKAIAGAALVFAFTAGLCASALLASPKPPVPMQGNPAAAVRVIIYQDLECPSCAEWHKTLESEIIPAYGKRVAFEFRDFPLPQHTWSFNAAVLARFFDARKLEWGLAWRDYCFTHQDDLTPGNLLDTAARFGAPYGIGRADISQAFFNAGYTQLVETDRNRGLADHVEHTPTVLLNGVEATSPDQLKNMLDAALHSAPPAA